LTKKDYLYPRDKNDDNTKYTMADAVFTACFLSACNRNCDLVEMANFAPIVNTRGCIFTYRDGIVLRSTYHVFDLYTNLLGETIIDLWSEDSPKINVVHKNGESLQVDVMDLLATMRDDGAIVIAAINKDSVREQTLQVDLNGQYTAGEYRIHTLCGDSTEAYNDVDHIGAKIQVSYWKTYEENASVILPPHSVNILEYQRNVDAK
jgi:alpha-N-arabinofuranosidase